MLLRRNRTFKFAKLSRRAKWSRFAVARKEMHTRAVRRAIIVARFFEKNRRRRIRVNCSPHARRPMFNSGDKRVCGISFSRPARECLRSYAALIAFTRRLCVFAAAPRAFSRSFWSSCSSSYFRRFTSARLPFAFAFRWFGGRPCCFRLAVVCLETGVKGDRPEGAWGWLHGCTYNRYSH